MFMGASGSKSSNDGSSPSFLSRIFGQKTPRSSDPWDVSADVRKLKSQATRSGGFSDIYEGELGPVGGKKKPRLVAIKALRAVHLSTETGDKMDPDSKEAHLRLDKRLQREMRVWRPLKHPRIVPCLGYATVDGAPCLVSPWYENGNARDYVANNPTCNRRAIVVQVAEGLVYLHSRVPAVVHYDVKSVNVMIGDDTGAMLTDFGIAKVLEDIRTGLTTNNASAFTVRCSSPEALEGEERTVKSDVYSFACFALEIMTGKAPFYDLKTSAAVIAAKYSGAVPDPAKFPELRASDPLWNVMRRCWSSDPNQRPTMPEVLAELRNLGYRA